MLSANNLITAGAVGNSDHITLPAGDQLLIVNSDNWTGAQTTFLQVGNGVKFGDMKDEKGDKVSFTEDGTVIMPGGLSYRLRTTTYTSAITVTPANVPTKR